MAKITTSSSNIQKKTFMIRVQRPSKEPEQNWKDKMEVRKAVLEQYDYILTTFFA